MLEFVESINGKGCARTRNRYKGYFTGGGKSLNLWWKSAQLYSSQWEIRARQYVIYLGEWIISILELTVNLEVNGKTHISNYKRKVVPTGEKIWRTPRQAGKDEVSIDAEPTLLQGLCFVRVTYIIYCNAFKLSKVGGTWSESKLPRVAL